MPGYGLGYSSLVNRSIFSSGPSVDPDAQAFITAAGITDPTQQSAIETLVTDLKGYGIWTKMKALYPFVGGTASTHKWNLKNPQDTNAAYRLTFAGGWTHSVNGALPNGTNAYADAYITNSAMSYTSTHLSLYSRTDAATAGIAMGNTTNQYCMFYTRNSGNFQMAVNAAGFNSAATANSQGHYIATRTGSNASKGYKNGTTLITSTSAVANDNTTMYLAAAYRTGVGALGYDNKEIAFASIGDGLDDTEAANYYTAVQAFQTTLGRSIGTQTVSDADAQAFVTAASITDQVQATAINNLVIGMKADGLWTKMKAVYPFVGGTASSHKWNLKNPLDTNAAFRLTFSGGITHSSSGVKGNSTNGYYETYLNPATEFSLSTGGSGFVSINENLDAWHDFGAFTSGVNYRFQLAIKFGGSIYASMLANPLYNVANSASTIGFYGVTRQPNDNNDFYTILDTTSVATSASYQEPNTSINGFALNIDNGSSRSLFGERRQSFACFGEGLTTAEAQLLRTRVNTFNNTLGR